MKTFITLMALSLMTIPVLAQEPSWIGLSVEDGKDNGAEIRRIETGSPAEKAGLRTGDLIVEYNNSNVLGAVQFTRLVRETPPGRTVQVKVRRDNRDETLQLTTGRFSDVADRFAIRSMPDLGALRDGRGIVQDYQEARKWMQLAAEGSNAYAQYALGQMYRVGLGVPVNNVKAYVWLNVAAARGVPGATGVRDIVVSKLSTPELQEAQAESRRISDGHAAKNTQMAQ